ncbi:MAG: 16S rRNA (uracil(1498)-N(3))-methyltransferase [Gammaproteobacteria bacterium]|nr:16S rRNA (uracil(1498)-N(3))-methyltransferase [Gammaproteobacteria bacterium]
MALSRLYVSSELRAGSKVQLDADQARYVGRALRLRVGDSLSVFNGDDGEFAATLVGVSKVAATVVLGEQVKADTESSLKVHLVQGVSRGERMDFVVQKATELGVKRISPVLTEYGMVKFDATRAGKRRDHWRKIAASACEQSGRIRPPLIDPPVTLNTWFGDQPQDADIDLILERGAAASLTEIAAPETEVCVLVGPEGGFSPGEYDDASSAGFMAVSLGPRTLRTETAALAAIAILQSRWGDMR